MIYFFIANLLFIVVNLLVDWAEIKEGRSPNHTLGAIVRLTVISFICFLFSDSVSTFFVSLFLSLSIFWILFDVVLNKLRGLPLFYVGRTAFIDRTFRQIAPLNFEAVMFSVKVVLFLLSLVLYIYIYK